MRSRLDPLRYGLRALDEMAREQASVAPPAQSRATEFTPHPTLRSPARDGAALSLRRASEGVVNDAEAKRAIELVTDLVASGVAPSDIAVLTPFVGQSVRIERELVTRKLDAIVSTVHRLQGGERRIVIFSVTATEPHHLRWLGERPHLLHVATSRAQEQLVVLVDPDAAARTPALAPFAELLATLSV